MSTPYLADPDVTLYCGDVLSVLRELPAESVDCCVTSPPYWGLRCYGVDGQLGLEPTPEEFVSKMVEVFREVRRVLAPHGTVWLNLGDSYAQQSGRKDRYEGDSGRISRVEDGAQTRPLDGGAAAGGAGLPAGSERGDDRGGAGARLSASELVGRKDEFRERGEERGYDVGSNFANYGGRIGEARSTVVSGLKPKDLVGIPWRVAFALQADGWYLRSDIIWAKPNPMPESVTDRPTKAHEYVFLLSKQPRYFFDQEAVREAHVWPVQSRHNWNERKNNGEPVRRGLDPQTSTTTGGGVGSNPAGRNIRSVWEIATQPYPEAHFATFPEELARRCIAAGCPKSVCRVCGKARERVVEYALVSSARKPDKRAYPSPVGDGSDGDQGAARSSTHVAGMSKQGTTLGFTDCGHSDYRPGLTLDPFIGSGTVAHVARKLGRHAVGIDLNESYLQLAARRLQQQSLFAEMP